MTASESRTDSVKPRIRIVGGGVAGIEAALALAALAPGLAETSLISPDPDFVYKPLVVAEPFGGAPSPRHELKPLLAESGTRLIRGALERVDADARRLELSDGSALDYDMLVLCVGGRDHPAYPSVHTFWSGSSDLAVDDLIEEALGAQGRTLSLVVPPGTSWPLPLYELALMFRRRADEGGHHELRIHLLTPEEAPLAIFGRPACSAVEELLAARRIEVDTGVYVVDDEGIAERGSVGTPLPRQGPVVALPTIGGPAVPGLPADPAGFIPIDDNCHVPGTVNVYAAGDGTTFPVKQGGLATQQADAAAEHIASTLGAKLDPQPFRPVLRGQLVTQVESLNLLNPLSGGAGEGAASADYLWWPPDKISGRYLSAGLYGTGESRDLDPAMRPLEIEISWPNEWHSQPLTQGLDDPPR